MKQHWKLLGIFGLMACLQAGIARCEDVAVVNGVKITSDDVDKAFKRTSVSDRQLSDEQTKLYRKHVLDVLVNECLISQHLDAQKVAADEAKVNKHIEEVGKRLSTKGKTLESFLAEMGISEDRMKSDIRNIHRWIAYVETQASEKALAQYFEANKPAFDGSMVRASHILVKLSPTPSAAEKKAARDKIDGLRQQLAGGVAFADLAKQYSDCPSKKDGGDLDFFPRKGVMSEAFAATAYSLQPGQVSSVVETEFGYHLIVVTDRKPGKPITYPEVADEVKACYADDLRGALVARMRQSADIKILR